MKLKWKLFIWLFILIVLIFIFSRTKFPDKETHIPENDFYVFPPFLDFYKSREPDFQASEVNNNLEKYFFDKRLRNKLFESANMMTEPDKNPKVKIIEEADKGNYIERKISIEIYPNTLSYGYMLTPKNITYPAPLILAMHPHGGIYELGTEAVVGHKGDKEWSYGKELAERGYVVFAMDAPLFGTR